MGDENKEENDKTFAEKYGDKGRKLKKGNFNDDQNEYNSLSKEIRLIGNTAIALCILGIITILMSSIIPNYKGYNVTIIAEIFLLVAGILGIIYGYYRDE